jgi:hypothetical protein
MSFIKTYDNILNPSQEDFIKKISTHNLKYGYYENIIDSFNEFNPGFTSVIYNPDSNFINFDYYSIFSQIVYTLCFKQKITLEQIFRIRTFLTLPLNKDQLNGIHNDLSIPHWVLLYYVNDSDGDTIFFDDNKNEIKRVSPKKGRIIFFDGKIKHTGSYPSKNQRIGVNINFIGKFNK